MLPPIRFKRAKSFEYRVALGNTLGDITQEGDALPEKVADESRVAVRELPFLSVPASVDDYLDVIVSHVQAFDRVYVQLKNLMTELTEVNDDLQKFYTSEGHKQLCNPYRGQLCTIKYSQNGQYYRAAVVCRPDPVNVKVYCVDYGMTVILVKEGILQLATQFYNQPPLAIAVQMTEVIEGRISMNLDQFRACLEMKPVTLRLDAQKGDKYLVSMTISDENGAPVNMSDILMGVTPMPAGHSPTTRHSRPAISCSPLLTSTACGADLPKQKSVPTVVLQQLAGQHEDLSHSYGYPTPPLSKQASSAVIVTKIDAADISVPAQDVCVRFDGASAKPSRFYVQLDRFIEQLQQMSTEIKEPTTPLGAATIGMPCIANYLKGWYRAEVIAVNGQTVTLRYVDYGNVEMKEQSEVFAITEEQPEVVRSTHKLAIPCKLIGIDPVDGIEWSDSAVEMFHSAFPEACTAHIDIKELREDDQMFLVELKVDEQSVAESLLAQNAAKMSLPAVVRVTKIESAAVSTPLREAAVRSDDDNPGSPSHFYLQLDRFADKLQQVLNEIKQPTVLVDHPEIGMVCIANFAGGWYRAEIIDINDDSMVVQYVDYGNVEEKKLNEVFAITDEQSDVVCYMHKLAVPCKLISNEGKEWSVESFKAAFPMGETVQVDIKAKEGELLLVDVNGSALSVKNSPDSPVLAQESVAVGTGKPAAINVTKIDAAVVSVPVQEVCLRSDDNFSSTPARFYVQLERFFDRVQQMLDEIKQPTVLLDQSAVGMACIANFAGGWYRAEIIATNDDSLVVQYVDYGNLEAKQRNEVFAITDEQPEVVLTSHKLAVPCKLVNKEWSVESFQTAFPEESSFQVDIQGCDGELFLVDVMTV